MYFDGLILSVIKHSKAKFMQIKQDINTEYFVIYVYPRILYSNFDCWNLNKQYMAITTFDIKYLGTTKRFIS